MQGILSQLQAPPKGRRDLDRSYYTYGAEQPPRGNSPPGALPFPGGTPAMGPNNASGPPAGVLGAFVGGPQQPPGAMPGPTAYAGGGPAGEGMLRALGGVRGPGSGREDLIDAQLADGEYVFDAESVALIGDGSTDEGIRRLEEMRKNLRSHKGKALARGKFSPDAMRPEQYLEG